MDYSIIVNLDNAVMAVELNNQKKVAHLRLEI
jgi:hypothetical protein